ncbi:MAG: serine hydroxymethyltransferase, partial [Aquificaceae bacterium]|nr:serine hydroxymethyltransferase [Aquificaceae bacterium]
RIGTPAMTTRGMKEEEMRLIARLIAKVIENINSVEVINKVSREVIELCQQFPLYPELKEAIDEFPYSKATHI